MKKIYIFLQGVVVLIGAAALVFLLWEPHLEGRNVNATVFQIYFNDPFLAYAYISSTLFFTGAYQAFKVLGYAREDKFFTEAAVKSLRMIKYCAMATIGLVAAPLAYLVIVRPEDDIAGGVAMALFIILNSAIVSLVAHRLLKFSESRIKP